ncbi:MAG: hypothetical protein ACI87W_001489 [Halieaceae bacterium]|jgi:hypothetical protein
MDRLLRIQRVSTACRYLLLGGSVLLGGAFVLALLTPGQNWISIGEGRFFELWNNGQSGRLTLAVIMLPLAVTLILGVYWLQRLFGEYQQGHFFSEGSMRCYVWLVWLKAFSFVYALIWPLLLAVAGTVPVSLAITVDAGSLVELLVLLLIVNLLKEAQQLNEENKGFV